MTRRAQKLIAILTVILTPAAAWAQGTITTIAGGGPVNLPALSSSFQSPIAFTRDSLGNSYISVSAYFQARVYKVDSSGKVSIYAGSLSPGYSGDGGAANQAQLDSPAGLASDAQGNLFIADENNCVIREVAASSGIITTVAGTSTCGYNGDNVAATAAELYYPVGVAVDGSGNLFIADSNNQRIREVSANGSNGMTAGNIYTFAGTGTLGFAGDGQPAAGAELNYPLGVFVDGAGNLFITDTNNQCIREVPAATANGMTAGNIYTIAGTGTPGSAGDGLPAVGAELSYPSSVWVDGSGNLFIADTANQRIREVPAVTANAMTAGDIYTVAGNGTAGYTGDTQAATSAELTFPTGVFVDGSGNLFITDYGNFVIRGVSSATGKINTFAGNGTLGFSGDGYIATDGTLNIPWGLATNQYGDVFIADELNCAIREVLAKNGTMLTVAGVSQISSALNGYGCSAYGGDGGPATATTLNLPSSVFVDSSGNIFIADYSNCLVREVIAATGNIVTVAGSVNPSTQQPACGYSGDNGPAIAAQLDYPSAVFVDSSGNLFIADTNNHLVREVPAVTANGMTAGFIYRIAGTYAVGGGAFGGDGGLATSAQLSYPSAIFVDNSENLFIADTNNSRIREVPAVGTNGMTAGNIYTIAGNGTSGYNGDNQPAINAELHAPDGLLVDSAGNVFVSELFNCLVRKVDGSTGYITTVAGLVDATTQQPVCGYSGDGGPATSAQIFEARGLAAGPGGSLLIADGWFNVVRQVSGVTVTPWASVSPASLAFAGQVTGTPSAPQILTLKNTGTAALTVNSISVNGANGTDFAETDNCVGQVIQPNSSCAVNVTFLPTLVASEGATLTIANTANSPLVINLAGTGVAATPAVTLSSTSLTFNGQTVGTSSTAQTVTLTNSGTAALNITSIAVGGTNNADFGETNNCGTSLGASAICTINVTFTPAASGARSASITITDSAAGSPQTISLSGSGSTATLSLSIAGNGSASQTVKAGQTATYNLQLTTTGGSPTSQISATVSCSGAPALSQCSGPSSAVAVTPSAPGLFSILVSTTGHTPAGVAIPQSPRDLPPAMPRMLLLSLVALLILAGMLCWTRNTTRYPRAVRMALSACVLLMTLSAAMLVGGCGGGSSSSSTPSTPAGTYTLTVTATASGNTQSLPLTLVVQ
jgi:sugar lactone lactonase YvrE